MSLDILIETLQSLLNKPYTRRLQFFKTVLQNRSLKSTILQTIQLSAIQLSETQDQFVSQWMGCILTTSLKHFSELRTTDYINMTYMRCIIEFINYLTKKFLSPCYVSKIGKETNKWFTGYCRLSMESYTIFGKKKKEITIRSTISHSVMTNTINLFNDHQLPRELQQMIVSLFIL